jgi:hypothetical protein
VTTWLAPMTDRTETAKWRCQCPAQCDQDGEGDSCWDDVTQEDFLCDWCRTNCAVAALAAAGAPQEGQQQ